MPKLLIDVEAKYAQFQDSLVQIERQSTDTVGKISQAFGGLNTILAGVGVSLGAAAFVAGLKQITDSIDALNDASDATGASVENLSALEAVARRNGETLDTVTTAAVKLNQALNEDAGGDKARILQAIGLSAQELRQQDPAQAVKTVADALAGSWSTGKAWWGVKEGAIDLVSIADDVPAELKTKVETVKAGLKDGSFSIWKGPILDQSGKELLVKDVVADDAFLGGIKFYVKGVEGKLPN